jgi:hypothetical protein
LVVAVADVHTSKVFLEMEASEAVVVVVLII